MARARPILSALRADRGPTEAWRRNLYILMLGIFATYTGFAFVMPFLPLFVTQLGVTDPGEAALWSGILFGLSPLLSGLLAPFWGSLADRFGRKAMLGRGLGVFALLILLTAFVTDIWQLLVLRALNGVFGGYIVLAIGLASAIAPRERVGEAIGLIQASQLAGGVGAPFIGGIVVDLVGLRGAFFVAAALAASGFLAFQLGFREAPKERDATVTTTTAKRVGGLRGWLSFPGFIGLLGAGFALQFIDRSFGPLLPLYLGTLNAPPERLGTISGVVLAGGAFATAVAAAGSGRLAGRINPRPLLVVATLCGAACCLPLGFAGHWGQVLALRLALGLLAGGAVTLVYAVGGRALPDTARVAAFSTLAGVAQIGGAISPMVTGLLARWVSLGAIFVLDAALYALVLLWALRMWRVAAREPARAPV